jgi:hypothetical protein
LLLLLLLGLFTCVYWPRLATPGYEASPNGNLKPPARLLRHFR